MIPFGVEYHHAGMLRKDRNIVEKLFFDGGINSDNYTDWSSSVSVYWK